MQSHDQLEKRVEALEAELARLTQRGWGGVRRRSAWGMGDVPFYEVALGPDPSRGELRGHAKAIVAVGDIATGVLALGGWARGLIAIGGLATGLVSLGGLSIGLALALGGGAIGGLALGGGAVGGVAIGGGAYGYYACGGAAAGEHVLSPSQKDPQAEAFFRRYRLERACRGSR